MNITAQADLVFATDGKAVKVQVLFGMNVIPMLGIQVLCSNGESMCRESDGPVEKLSEVSEPVDGPLEIVEEQAEGSEERQICACGSGW